MFYRKTEEKSKGTISGRARGCQSKERVIQAEALIEKWLAK
jgi:hypothetical protein